RPRGRRQDEDPYFQRAKIRLVGWYRSADAVDGTPEWPVLASVRGERAMAAVARSVVPDRGATGDEPGRGAAAGGWRRRWHGRLRIPARVAGGRGWRWRGRERLMLQRCFEHDVGVGVGMLADPLQQR